MKGQPEKGQPEEKHLTHRHSDESISTETAHYHAGPAPEYVETALQHAVYERLEDGSVFGEIPGLRGVWANADTETACSMELRQVLREWLALRQERGLSIPPISSVVSARTA